MFASQKIFRFYENPEAADPADRVLLLREGFSFWAFCFSGLWLLVNRLWLLLLGYVALLIVWRVIGVAVDFSPVTTAIGVLFAQMLLGFHVYDFQACLLKRRGYREAGILVASSDMAAEQRYYEHAA